MTGTTTGQTTLPTATDSDDTENFLTISLTAALQALANLFESATGHAHAGAGQGKPIGAAGIGTNAIATVSIQDGAVTAAKLAAGAVTLAVNQLANGGQDIAQRTLPVTANSAYGPDRWQINLAGTDTLSVNVDTTAANRKANSKQAASLAFGLGTGAGATSYRQQLKIADGYHHLLGATVSLRMPTKVNVASAGRAYIKSDGTGGTTTYSGYHTGGGTYENLDVINITVPTDATFVEVGLALATSATFYVDNVMLAIGAAAADYAGLTPDDETTRCFRYYQIIKPGSASHVFGVGGAISGATARYHIKFSQKMGGAATATVSSISDFQLTDNNGAANVSTNLVTYSVTAEQATFLGTIAANNLVAGSASLLLSNSANSALMFEWNP